ncbi:hypothetical protein TSAR_000658 [Trichomalopsis sarcophagae]|uniref:Uncharacterized protein n=1 Tax=Trichomalopsis sarcophagae TaxID=543379 RepID=A0A232EQ95_9HYME|nr:hypothetical protein TSAR_000658 [Trichomalopsis sarcophagae]
MRPVRRRAGGGRTDRERGFTGDDWPERSRDPIASERIDEMISDLKEVKFHCESCIVIPTVDDLKLK